MKSKMFSGFLGLTLAAVFLSACSAIARHHKELMGSQPASAASNEADPISGEWNVTFFVRESKTPATFKLKLDGQKVAGTAYSDHTGAGTLRDGSWRDNKLSFTLDFARHESIAVTGALKDGMLSGEFRTEGFVEKWEAKRK
jgi:hypothetical protein